MHVGVLINNYLYTDYFNLFKQLTLVFPEQCYLVFIIEATLYSQNIIIYFGYKFLLFLLFFKLISVA